jgi:hypothetical protein
MTDALGAVDSLGMAQPPADTGGRPTPAAAASFDNEGGYLDQTGQLRPNFNAEQLAVSRERWIAGWDRRAAVAKVHGRDLSDFSAEARAAWIAKFDEAARADGLSPVEPLSPDLVQAHRAHALPIDPQPSQYRPVYAREVTNGKDATGQPMTAERLGEINTELTNFAAALWLTPALGTAVIERIAEVGFKIRSMDDDAKAVWVQAQDRVTLQRVGSEQALAQLKADAKAALVNCEGDPKARQFAKLLAESPHLNDAWLLATLAQHSRSMRAFVAKYGSAQ